MTSHDIMHFRVLIIQFNSINDPMFNKNRPTRKITHEDHKESARPTPAMGSASQLWSCGRVPSSSGVARKGREKHVARPLATQGGEKKVEQLERHYWNVLQYVLKSDILTRICTSMRVWVRMCLMKRIRHREVDVRTRVGWTGVISQTRRDDGISTFKSSHVGSWGRLTPPNMGLVRPLQYAGLMI